MRLQVLSGYYLLSNESQRSLLLHPSFWSYPACLVVVGRTGEAPAYVLAPQRKVRNEPFLRSHLCTGGVREMGTVVCYHQLMSQQTISKPLCIFFFSILMHPVISLAEPNQLMQTYAKSRKGRLIEQED